MNYPDIDFKMHGLSLADLFTHSLIPCLRCFIVSSEGKEWNCIVWSFELVSIHRRKSLHFGGEKKRLLFHINLSLRSSFVRAKQLAWPSNENLYRSAD